MSANTPAGIKLELRRHFDDGAVAYDLQTEWRRDNELLTSIGGMLPKGAGTVIDLGAGTGLVTNVLVAAARRVVRLDLSAKMLLSRELTVGDAIVGDAEMLPLRSASCDGCAMRQLLHYTNDDLVLNELRRVLLPEGWLVTADIVATDATDLAWWSAVKGLVQPLRRRCYSTATHRRLFEHNGWVVEEAQQLTLTRCDSWATFTRHVRGGRHPEALGEVETLVSAACDGAVSFRIERSGENICYEQVWQVLRARVNR